MAQSQSFLLCFILVNVFVACENAAAYKAEAHTIRKLGKQQLKPKAPVSSPAQAPQLPEKHMQPAGESPTAAIIEANNNGENVSVEGQSIQLQNHHHHAIDKSVAGGGVILGGLATTFLVAVFCYIRATGRHKSETCESTTEIH